MARRALRYIASVAFAMAATHATAGITPDPSGLWYDPNDSGWGLTLAQQGEKVFAVLYVYDADSLPAWYFASDLEVSSDFSPLQHASGTLYRATGPWFGGAFDPRAVAVTAVGTLNVVLLRAQSSMQVTYVIDGTTTTATVQPQTWGDNSALMEGAYAGGLRINARSPTNCPDLFSGVFERDSLGVTLIAPGQLRFEWATSGDSLCRVEGQYAQLGQSASVSGRIGCSDINGNPPPLPGPNDPAIQLTGLAVNKHGFSGAVTIENTSCSYSGHIGGVRLP